MKALVYTDVETLTYTDAPMPVAGVGQSVVKIMASGICGSDMHAFLGHDPRRPAPFIFGHEAAGTIVGGPEDGRRVTERTIISMPPAPGAFAGYVAMRTENLVTVPDDVPLMQAALTEPLACGWHAVKLADAALDRPVAEARCVVIGGGAIGVGAALALQAWGARDITVLEPNTVRRDALAGIDGFDAVDPKDAPSGADVVIDGVGYAATRADASAIVRPGGVIAHIGLGEAAGGLDVRRMTLQEITFIGTYTYTADDFRATAQAIFDGRFGPLDWVTTRPLAEGQQAFTDIRSGVVAAPKIILIPDHEE